MSIARAWWHCYQHCDCDTRTLTHCLALLIGDVAMIAGIWLAG